MQTWIRALKLAVINIDEREIGKLLQRIPKEFTCKEELMEAAALLQEAKIIYEEKKKELGKEMTKLNKVRDYLKKSH